MRHNDANLWVLTVLASCVLVTGVVAVESIETIDGERYEQVRVLKVEADGVIIKHAGGIAKVPFYELDEAVRSEFGHTGEVLPPIRHKEAPQAGLLPAISGSGVDSADDALDLSSVSERGAEPGSVSVPVVREEGLVSQGGARRGESASEVAILQRAVAREAKPMHKVGVSAIGVASPDRNARAGVECCRQRGRGFVTTKYTPYGNFTYYGTPPHWYAYTNPPCNRCQFERVDFRRWQGRR